MNCLLFIFLFVPHTYNCNYTKCSNYFDNYRFTLETFYCDFQYAAVIQMLQHFFNAQANNAAISVHTHWQHCRSEVPSVAILKFV